MKHRMAELIGHFSKIPDDRLADVIDRLDRVAKLDQRLLAAARKEMRIRHKRKAA